MAFSRPEYDEDSIQWDRIRARIEDDDGSSPDEEFSVDGLRNNESSDDDESSEDGAADKKTAAARPARPARSAGTARRPVRPLPRVASPEVAEQRLPLIRQAAERVRKMKQVAVDPGKKYRLGQVVFDPAAQRFGEVAYAAEGYVRLRLRDGSESAHGKPPLEDRRNFIVANFERMDNKTMSEILGISVHTMRRLCHEYGLKRHGKAARARKSA